MTHRNLRDTNVRLERGDAINDAKQAAEATEDTKIDPFKHSAAMGCELTRQIGGHHQPRSRVLELVRSWRSKIGRQAAMGEHELSSSASGASAVSGSAKS